MKKNTKIVETEPVIGIDLTEKKFVNPAFPKEIYDRAIEAKNIMQQKFVDDPNLDMSDWGDSAFYIINDMVKDLPNDAQITASCGEFTFNRGHGWEFKMPSTRDIMAQLHKADENPDLRYTIRFSQMVSQQKDQFGTMTEKLVRYFYIRKFNKEEV